MTSLFTRVSKHLFSKMGLFVLFILLECLVLVTWNVFQHEKERAEKRAFDDVVSDLSVLLKNSLIEKAQVLAGLKGLYEASSQVDEQEFMSYIRGQRLAMYQRGILGFHYAEFQSMPEAQGNIFKPRMNVFEDANAARVDWQNVLQYPSVQESIDYAVVNNSIAVSGLVEDDVDTLFFKNPTVLFVAPVFYPRESSPTHNGDWSELRGIVYIPYRMNELMSRIVVNITQSAHMHLYAGTDVVESALLLDTRTDKDKDLLVAAKYTKILRFSLYGKTFTVKIFSNNNSQEHFLFNYGFLLIFLGTLLNVFLIMLLYLLMGRAAQARQLAATITSDLQHKHHQLVMSESRFRLALEMSTMGAWTWHLDSNLIDWDESIYKVFGIDKNIPLKTYEDFLALLHDDDRDRVFNQIAIAIENKTQFDSEYRIPTGDTGFRYIASRAQLIFNNENHTFIMAGTCWDITERKRLDKLKTEFVSTVSHELRTPLTAISGALGLVVGGALGELNDKMRTVLDIAFKNTQRLKLLINDLLDMDKLLAGKLEFHCEPCSVAALVERAVAENKAYADQYQVKYVTRPMDNQINIHVEEARFLQIMANFLSNAAKFSPAQSEVIVEVTLNNGWVRVAVIDKGDGIPATAQDHIFEKFYQVDSSDTRKKGGTGLGLAITKEIAERMQGRVGFVSAVGVGSTFYAEFPVVKTP